MTRLLLSLLACWTCFAPVLVQPYRFASAPNTPPVTTDLILFAEAAQESYADNDAVATITDRSGNGINFTQATSSKQPTFKTAIVNSRAVYRFDGVDDEAKTTSRTWVNTQSVYIVCKRRTDGAAYSRLLEVGANTQFTLVRASATTVNAQWLGGTTAATTDTTAFKCLSFVAGGGTCELFSNGTSVGTASGSPGSVSTTATLCNYGGGGSYYGAYDVAAVLIYAVKHGTTDRQSIENWLIIRYGL